MPEVIVDTSPLQYLHQTRLLDLMPRLYSQILVPGAVAEELATGAAEGYDVPRVDTLPWVEVRRLEGRQLVLPAANLGAGEREVLTLAVEMPGSSVVLDDRWARHHARLLGVPVTGTLGILLKAKQRGLLESVRPVLERLSLLGFHLDAPTGSLVLRLANEAS